MNHYTWKNKQFKKLLLYRETVSEKKVVIIIVNLFLCECVYVCVSMCMHVCMCMPKNICVCICKHVCEYGHPHAMVNMWRSEDNPRCPCLRPGPRSSQRFSCEGAGIAGAHTPASGWIWDLGIQTQLLTVAQPPLPQGCISPLDAVHGIGCHVQRSLQTSGNFSGSVLTDAPRGVSPRRLQLQSNWQSIGGRAGPAYLKPCHPSQHCRWCDFMFLTLGWVDTVWSWLWKMRQKQSRNSEVKEPAGSLA